MSEEIKKPEDIQTEDSKTEEVKAEDSKKSTPETDVSKIKIRRILAQRIKKCGVKKIISFILVAVIFFCGGFFTDRFITRHESGRRFYSNPGIQRQIPGNFYGNKRFGTFGRNKGRVPRSNKTPVPNQSQGTTPSTGQK